MSSPGTLRFGQVSTTPSPPPSGYDLIYVKTDDVLYIQDSFGVEVALGSSSAITSLTGEVTASGPGAAVATVSNAAVIGKVLTGFTPGPNSPVLSTDTILQAFQKLQAQVNGTTGTAITALTGDATATGPGSVPITLATVNPDVGTFGTAGAVSTITVNGKGLITSASNTTIGGLTNSNLSGSAGITGTNIATNTISNSNLSQMSADTIKGNNTGSTANALDLTIPQIVTMFEGTPVTQIPDQTNTIGSTSTFAVADHIHNIPSGLPVNVGTTNIQGSAHSFALSDHVHALTASITTGQLLTGYTTGTNTPIIASNSILTAFENLQAQISATGGSAITALTGDVSATGPGSVTATVNSVGGSTAANINSTVIEVAAATSANTPSTLVIRDSSGNFSSGTITATLNGNASNITATSNSTLTTLPDLSLPTSQLSGNVSLTTQVSGILPVSNGGTNNSTPYTAGSIIFSNGTSLTQDNANFYWNDANQSMGIGTIPAISTFIDAVNISGSTKRLVFTGYGTGSYVGFRNRFARGTSGTPTAVQSGDTLGFISGQGYGASQFPTASTGAATFVAGETFTNTSNLTYFTVSTTPTASVTSTENFRVASTGVTLGPQTASTSVHQINGGQARTNKTITANYTVDTTTTDDIIYCNASTAITITLPTPTSGRTLVIKDISGAATTNNITIARHASENIEGLASSYLLQVDYQTVIISSDSTNWWIF